MLRHFLLARPDPYRGRNPDADRTRTSRRHGGQIASQVTPPHVVRPGNKILLFRTLLYSPFSTYEVNKP